MKPKKTISLISLFCCLTLCFCQNHSRDERPLNLVEKKINSKGQLLIKDLEEKGLWQIPLSVLIEANSAKDIIKLKRTDFQIRFNFMNFCTGDISAKNLDSLARLPFVKAISISNSGQNRDNSPPPRVAIGIIDKGIDWRSKIFRNESGKTKILCFWDQTDPRGGSSYIPPYGSEYSGAQLSSLEENYELLPHLWGHGTHVAGIAGGELEIKDTYGRALFTGKEIHSALILVNTTGKEDHVLDGVAYILEKARQIDANCVINLSYGKHYGPHDDSHIYTKALDSALTGNCIMVVSAGNSGEKRLHSRRRLQEFTTFVVDMKSRYELQELQSSKEIGLNIELWVEKNLNLEVSLKSPGSTTYGPVHNGEFKEYNTGEGKIVILNSVSNPAGKFKDIQLFIGNNENQSPAEGCWEIQLHNIRRKKNTTVYAWITSANFCEAEFSDQGATVNTVSALAASKKIISVGSYILNKREGAYARASFSNSGFTADRRKKPDVLTIGEVTIKMPEINENQTFYGTSISAALITRLIGLVWEKYPDLDAQTIKDVFQKKAVFFGNPDYPWKDQQEYKKLSLSSILFSFENARKPFKEIPGKQENLILKQRYFSKGGGNDKASANS